MSEWTNQNIFQFKTIHSSKEKRFETSTMSNPEYDKDVYPFPGKVKSSVWEYFGFYKDETDCLDKSKAICKLCRRAISYTGNTTNLRAHVITHHRGEEGVEERMLTPRGLQFTSPGTSSSSLSGSGMLRTFGDVEADYVGGGSNGSTSNNTITIGSLQKNEAVNSAILKFAINDLVPLEVFDSQSFRHLIQVCSGGKVDPNLPRIEDISAMLYSSYFSAKQRVAESLIKAEEEYMKIEIWKTVQSQYMTIGVQTINENWEACSFVLNTFDLGDRFTAGEIADHISNTVQDWNLFEEMTALSDGHDEVAEAVARMSSIHVSSLEVSINRVAELCVERQAVQVIVKYVREIVQLFKEQDLAMGVLQEKQKVLQMSYKKLVADDNKDWKSTLAMLESFCEASTAVLASLNDPALSSQVKVRNLTNKEMTFVQSVVNLLKPLKMAYSLSHNMKYPMMSVILPVMKKLEVALTSSSSDSQIIAEVKDLMLSRLRESYSEQVYRELLLLSSLLDPRYKDLKFVDELDQELAYELLKKAVEEVNSQASGNTEKKGDLLQSSCIKVEVEDHEFSSCSSEDTSATTVLMEQLDGRPVKRRRHVKVKKETEAQSDPINDWLADVVRENVSSEKEEDNVANEISRYKSELQILSTSSPLLWWKDRTSTYPILSLVAKKYVCAPAVISNMDETSQATYERQRANLTDSNLEMMVFLNGNKNLLDELAVESSKFQKLR